MEYVLTDTERNTMEKRFAVGGKVPSKNETRKEMRAYLRAIDKVLVGTVASSEQDKA